LVVGFILAPDPPHFQTMFASEAVSKKEMTHGDRAACFETAYHVT
jgi:hypothetical protein